MDRLRNGLYAGIVVCGLLMIPLSFLPWVNFETLAFEDERPTEGVTLTGAHVSRWRDAENVGPNDPKREVGWCSCPVDVGDGYLTAGLGAMLAAIGGLGWWTWRDRIAAIVAIVASVLAFGLSGFDAIADWKAIIWTSNGSLEAAEGGIQAALIGLIVASALAAVFAGVLWGLVWLVESAEEEMMEDDMSTEGTEQWA